MIVALLILLNVVLGTRQELKARESIDALPTSRCRRRRSSATGRSRSMPATEVVPGDIVQLEAGDIVPADGRHHAFGDAVRRRRPR